MINKTKLAKEFIEQHTVNGISKFSKKKLGELLTHKHPDLFQTSEIARNFVRLATDAAGDRMRKEMKTKTEWNGFQLPKPEKNDFSKLIIRSKRIGILSDIHFPYYDAKALNAAIAYLIKWKPDCIVLNGDIVDCYHGSDFMKDPRQRDLPYEFDMLRAFLKQLVELFPKARIIYKLGNHEERYERAIMKNLPYFIDLQWMNFETAVNWDMKYKIEIVKNKRLLKAGHLNIAHGHEFSKGFIAPVNVARGFYLKAKANVIAGHHHRLSEHPETDINGKLTCAWSTGCLCELHPAYMPINSWQHGFATVEIDGNNFKVDNIKIDNGKIL